MSNHSELGAGEDHDANRKDFEHPVVELEGRRLTVALPVQLESDLRHVPVFGAAGGDAFGQLR